MASEDELWCSSWRRGEAVLAQLLRATLCPSCPTSCTFSEPDGRSVRISTTADRHKESNSWLRDPRAVLHVGGDDFWAFSAVAEGSPSCRRSLLQPGDRACQQLAWRALRLLWDRRTRCILRRDDREPAPGDPSRSSPHLRHNRQRRTPAAPGAGHQRVMAIGPMDHGS